MGPDTGSDAEGNYSCAVLCQYILVSLWRVWAHLEEQNVAGSVELAVSYNHILGIIALASEGDTSTGFLEIAVLYDDVAAGSIGAVLVYEGSLAAFQTHTVIVHVYPTASYQHILASIDVYGVGAWTFRIAACRCVDIQVEVFHALALVQMVGPETRVHHSDAAYLHVVGVGDVDQSWAESLQVGTLLDDFSAQPEFIVEFMSVAVEGSLACNGETIVMIGIDECCKIV